MIKPSTPIGRPARHSLLTLLSLLIVTFAALVPHNTAPAFAAAPVWYDSFNKIIYVGRDYNPADPAEAPYIGYPAHPQAPKTPITIPQVAAALNNPALLEDQGGGAGVARF